jgi:hypothetical protein
MKLSTLVLVPFAIAAVASVSEAGAWGRLLAAEPAVSISSFRAKTRVGDHYVRTLHTTVVLTGPSRRQAADAIVAGLTAHKVQAAVVNKARLLTFKRLGLSDLRRPVVGVRAWGDHSETELSTVSTEVVSRLNGRRDRGAP